MRFLAYALVATAIALTSLAALASSDPQVVQIAGLPAPVPTLRPAAPNEVPNREWVAKQAFLKAKFPGAIAVPSECKWIRIDPNQPPTMFAFRLECAPMEVHRP